MPLYIYVQEETVIVVARGRGHGFRDEGRVRVEDQRRQNNRHETVAYAHASLRVHLTFSARGIHVHGTRERVMVCVDHSSIFAADKMAPGSGGDMIFSFETKSIQRYLGLV